VFEAWFKQLTPKVIEGTSAAAAARNKILGASASVFVVAGALFFCK